MLGISRCYIVAFAVSALQCVMEVEKERIRLEKEADELALKESEGISRCAAFTSGCIDLFLAIDVVEIMLQQTRSKEANDFCSHVHVLCNLSSV